MTKHLTFWLAVIVSALVLGAAASGRFHLDKMEAVGFVTGAWCVLLAVNQNIWNWPIGIANNITFAILFWHKALYANMALQGVLLAISAYGWYEWLYGGAQHTRLRVTRITAPIAAVLIVISIPAAYFLMLKLRSVNDSAPLLDSVTTVMSLSAQFLLSRKMIENWYVWIAADVIYLGLYMYRELYLTTVLYFIFMLMCVQGVREWRAALEQAPAEAEAAA